MQQFNISHVYNNNHSHRSADGSLYIITLVYPDVRYPGKNSDNIFQVLALRTTDNGATFQRVPLDDSPTGVVSVSVEPEGMFLTYTNQGKDVRRLQVPGFQTPGVNGDVTVVAQPQTTDAALAGRVATLEQQVRALQQAPKPVAGISQQQVEAIAWSKANDAIWAQLQDGNSPLLVTIWQKAKDAAYATLKQYALLK